ncbi:DISARM anti-phage system protein DrmE domain-containing protein [Mammaliicoccus sciuri]
MGINKINLLNDYSNETNSIYNIQVQSKEIEELHDLFNKMKKEIYSEGLNELNEEFRNLKYIYYRLINTLKPYNDELRDRFDQDDWKKFTRILQDFYTINENMGTYIKKIIYLIKLFQNGKVINELKIEVKKLLEGLIGSTAIILINKNEEFLISNNNLNIDYYTINTFMKADNFYDNVLIIGNSIYFDKLNTIFMGNKIFYINFHKYYFKRNTIIEDNQSNSNIYKNVEFTNNDKNYKSEIIEEQFEMEQSENTFLLEKLISNYKNKVNVENKVNASICGLKSGYHILLSENTKIRILTIKKNDNDNFDLAVETKKIKQLDKEDWIIIKANTESIYLEKKAKEIISEETYNTYKKFVFDYKKALNIKLKENRTLNNLYKDMKKSGVNISNMMTLKTWLKEDIINPRNLNQILRYLNYNDENFSQTIKAAEMINKLHRKVGKDLSKSLQQIIDNIDISEIYESMTLNGNFSFKVDDIGEYFIEEILFKSEDQIEIERNQLYKILK